MRMRHIAEDAYLTMPDQDRQAMQAYARGVNAYIETHQEQRPLRDGFTSLSMTDRDGDALAAVCCARIALSTDGIIRFAGESIS